MRNLKKLFLGLALGAALFTSCKGEDPAPNAPTITATPTTTTAAPGQDVAINVIANAATGAKLTNYEVQLEITGVPTADQKPDVNPNATTYAETFTYTVPAGASGTHTLVFRVTDDAGQTSEARSVITVTGFSQVQDCGNKTLGNQLSQTGSSFSTAQCLVMPINQAKTNSGSVDFLHYYGAQNGATLASPDDASLTQFSAFDITTWATRRVTRFKKLTGVDYATVTTAAGIQAAFNSAAGNESGLATQLATGDVIGFRTQDGRFGILKVGAITGNNTTAGTIAFDLKVQK